MFCVLFGIGKTLHNLADLASTCWNKRKQKRQLMWFLMISCFCFMSFHSTSSQSPLSKFPQSKLAQVWINYILTYIYIYMIPLDISALKRPPTNQHLIAFRRSKSKFVLFFGNIISLMRAVHFNFIALIDRLLTRSAEEKHDLIIFDSWSFFKVQQIRGGCVVWFYREPILDSIWTRCLYKIKKIQTVPEAGLCSYVSHLLAL